MRTFLMTIVLLLTGGTHALRAHEEFRVVGKVTRIAAGELEVRMQNGKTVAMGIGDQTAVLNNAKKSTVAEIRKGQNVVVTAFGDSYDDLGALQVQIVKTLPKVPTRITKGAK